MKIKEYRLIATYNIDTLNDMIAIRIDEGWQPFGSPFIENVSTDKAYYYQAVVKYDESSEGIPNDKTKN